MGLSRREMTKTELLNAYQKLSSIIEIRALVVVTNDCLAIST